MANLLQDIKSKGLAYALHNTSTLDEVAINDYNQAISSGVPAQQALADAKRHTNKATIALIESTTGEIEVTDEMRDASALAVRASQTFARGLTTAFRMLSNVGLSIAISKVISLFYDMLTAHDRLLEKAKELGEEFSQEKSSIEDYKEKIDELQSVITDHTASFNDVSQARKNLMEIQDELIRKFGAEKDTIEIITSAINDQSDALDELTQKQYIQWKNDYSKKSFGDSLADFITGPNINNAFDKLTQLDLPGAWQALTLPGQSKISKMQESMMQASYYLDKTGNDLLDSFLAKTYGLTVDPSGTGFVIRGNLDEIHERLLEIQETATAFKPSESFESSISNTEIRMRNTLDAYRESYNIFMLYDKILKDSEDNPYAEQYAFINNAKEAYDNALLSGDSDQMKEASEKYAHTLQSAISLAMENSDEDVAYFFKSMYPDMQKVFGEWQFTINFEPNTDGLKGSVLHALDSIDGVSDETIGFSTEDIKNFNPATASQDQLDAYGELIQIANSYGLTLKQLISLLETMGIVRSEKYRELVNTFGQENIDTLSPGDLEIAYQIKNTGNMTFETLEEEIKRIKRASRAAIPLSAPQIVDQLDTRLRPVLESLGSAYRSIFSDGGFNRDAVDIPMLDSLRASIEELNNLQDVDINIDMDAFDAFVSTLTTAGVTQEQGQRAFDAFATSLFYATDATEGMTEETRGLVEQLLQSLGVTNAAEVAEYALLEARAKSVLAACDLAGASKDSFTSILAEGQAAGLTRQQIYGLTAAEIAYGQNGLNAGEKLRQLKELASAYGDTASAALATALANDLASGHTDMDSAVNDLMARMNAGIQRVDIDFSGLEEQAARAGSAAGRSYADALRDELSDLNSVISYIGSVIDQQIDLFNDQKDAAIDALEAEKAAAQEALEAEKALVQEKIDARQAEIDRIREASSARKEEISLQKAQYDLERMQGQKAILQYSHDRGMHYAADTDGLRQAREAYTEAKENILVSGLEKEISGLEDAVDGLDKRIEESNRHYDSLIQQTEEYWDSLIEGLETYKSHWQELSGLEERAKMEAALRDLGITREDLLDLSGSVLGSFRDHYLGVLQEIYANNDGVLEMLQQFGGISADALRPLAGSLSGIAEGIRDASAAITGGKEQTTEVSPLTDSITLLGETTGDTLGGPEGEGVTGQFGQLSQTIADAGSHVAEVISGITDLDGMTADCTITVHIETTGEIPDAASGTGIADAISSATPPGKSHSTPSGNSTPPKNSPPAKGSAGRGTSSTTTKGRASVTGSWGVREAGRTLVGELGRELWVHAGKGTFETVGDSGPEFIHTEKGDLILDHTRTEELLARGRITGHGGSPAVIPYDPATDSTPFGDAVRKWDAAMARLDARARADLLHTGAFHDRDRQMQEAMNQISNTSIATQHIRPNINVGGISITCPGVTSQAVMREVKTALNREFNGLHNLADQWIRR